MHVRETQHQERTAGKGMPIRQGESGVSEVIGSILTLGITVLLFTGIFIFVNGIPGPNPSIRSEFGAVVEPLYDGAGNWDGGRVVITHKGGEVLKNFSTEIYLTIAGVRTKYAQLGAGYGIDGNNQEWNAGEKWTVRLTNTALGPADEVAILIIDNAILNVVWEGVIKASGGDHPPIFTQKYLDSDPTSTIADPLVEGRTFTLFARVTDPDRDLWTNSVFVNESEIGRGTYQLNDTDGDGVFTTAFPAMNASWNGRYLHLNATDGSHPARTRVQIRISGLLGPPGPQGPQGNQTPSGGCDPNDPNCIANPAEFEIFNEVDWVAHGQGYAITNTDNKSNPYYKKSIYNFNQTDTIFVKVLSNILDDYDKANIFRLSDATTGDLLTPPSNYTFVHLGLIATYHKYQLSFPASSIFGLTAAGGCYNVYIEIQDTNDDKFTANTHLAVKASNGSAALCPTIRFFNDSAYTKPATNFKSWDMLYVEVSGMNGTDGLITFASVEVQDFLGGVQVRNGPISVAAGVGAVGNISVHPAAYRFSVNLLKSDQNPWLIGNAAYNLFVRIYVDSNEYYASLSGNLYINSPTSIQDIVDGWTDGGGTGVDKYYGLFHLNKGGYFERKPFAWRPSAGGQADTIGAIQSVAFADLDGDLDKDIIAALEGGSNSATYLTLYTNLDGNGLFSRQDIFTVTTVNVDFCAVAAGDVDGDGLYDIVAATDNGNVSYYANDGAWGYTSTIATGIGTCQSGETNGGSALAIGNLDADRYGEVAVGTSSGLRVYGNNSGTYNSWTLNYSDTTNTNVVSVVIGEVGYSNTTDNNRNDIVVGYTTGRVAAYLNNGSQYPTPFVRVDVDTVNRGDLAFVGIGNIDGSASRKEIVSGVAGKILIYSTSNNGKAGSWSHLANDDDSGASTRPNAVGAITGLIWGLKVGNIDGAVEDDVAIVTSLGRVYYYRNLGTGSEWKRFLVEATNAWLGRDLTGYCIAIGDANNGN